MMSSRRKFLVGTVTVGSATLAGCTQSGSVNTLSWGEAFQEHLSNDDASVLDLTPVIVDSVSTETEVKTALAVLGWTKAGIDVSDDTISQMTNFATTAADARDAISPTLTRLNEATDLVDDMKETSALGVSVWDALVTAKPPLDGFDTAARDIESLLQGVSGELEDIETATRDTSAQIKEINAEQTTDYGNLPEAVGSAITVTGNLITDIQDVIDQVVKVEGLTNEAIDAADDLPALNREVSSTFGSLNSQIRSIREEFEEIEDDIETLQNDLEGLQSGANNQANQRFESISNDATGSEQQMTIADIDTTVEAYRSN